MRNSLTCFSQLKDTRDRQVGSKPANPHTKESQEKECIFVCLSYTEMIVLGGNQRWAMVEKYDVDGNMVETLPNLKIGR